MTTDTQIIRPRLQIIRGMYGTGKSTVAKSIFPHIFTIERGQYLMRGGVYHDDTKTRNESNQWFDSLVDSCMNIGMDIVVTGVYPTDKSIRELADKALKLGYEIWIKTMQIRHGNDHLISMSRLAAASLAFQPDWRLEAMFKRYYGSYLDRIHLRRLMPKTFKVDHTET